jgi:putative hemolysin
MKDQPPERDRRSEQLLRRIETNIALTLAVGLVSLWLLGQQSVANGAQHGAVAPFMMPAGGLYAVFAVLGIIVLNGLFILAETAVDLLKSVHVKHVKEEESSQSARLQRLIDGKSKYVAACTLASHIARVAMILVGLTLAPGVTVALERQFQTTDNPWLSLVAALLVALPIAVVNLMFELIPKSYAVLHPHMVALRLYRFIMITSALLSGPAKVVSGAAGLLTSRFGGRASFTIANQAEEEIKTLVESAQETGEIEVDEKELLHSVFEFSDTVARQVMTPRVDLDAMPIASDPMDVLRLIEESGHSRIPLYEETDDQIAGVVHAKDLLLARVNATAPVNLRTLIRPALFVPENMSLHELLQEMRAGKSQLAVVQDEFGGTAGIVTIEDIVEELVGDIVDEYDVEEPEVIQTDRGYIVEGKTHLDDINDELGTELDSPEFDTVGGYVFGLFGRQPKQGETIEAQGVRFTVEETDGRRIVQLLLEKAPETTDVEALDMAE